MTSHDPRHTGSLDPWRTQFVLGLRLANIRGAEIGDALAQVDAHCADSSEEPSDAFGDPRAYAAEVAGQTRAEALLDGPSAGRAGLVTLGAIAGFGGLLAGVSGLRHGGPATLSTGSLIGAVLGAGVVAALVRFGPLLLAASPTRRRLRGGLALMMTTLALGSVVAVSAIWRSPAVALDAWVSIALAVAMLGASASALGPVRSDPVVDPVTGADALPANPRLDAVVRWLPPLTLVAAVLFVLIGPGG